MNRYTIETPPYGKARMEPDENGKWVKFEDLLLFESKILDKFCTCGAGDNEKHQHDPYCTARQLLYVLFN